MSDILAIEADWQRRALLKALIHKHVQGEATMVDSVKAAIACFETQQPDLIVAPTLLSPADSEQLIAYVKQYAEPHVQLLTVPALDMLREAAPETNHGRRLFRRRRPVNLGLQYDPAIVGRQIADRLYHAQVLREEIKTIHQMRALAKADVPDGARPVQSAASPAASGVGPNRRGAERTAQRKLPGPWTIRLPWGTDVDLVNISRTGILVESGSKVAPGVTLDLQLSGMGLHRLVPARFVRSEIARVDRLGVRYHAAAHFAQPLDLLPPPTEQAPRSTRPSIVDLFTAVLADAGQAEAPSIRFVRAVRELVGARDVRIGRTPLATADDCESIYFRVGGDERSGTILQVLFDRDRALSAAEFRLLKAAAGLTAAAVELERAAPEDAWSAEPMARVA